MELASAYPNSAISTGAMVAIAVVAAGTLAFWLAMIFVADRQRRNLSARLAHKPGTDVTGPVVEGPDETAEDELNAADHGGGTRRIQPAA